MLIIKTYVVKQREKNPIFHKTHFFIHGGPLLVTWVICANFKCFVLNAKVCTINRYRASQIRFEFGVTINSQTRYLYGHFYIFLHVKISQGGMGCMLLMVYFRLTTSFACFLYLLYHLWSFVTRQAYFLKNQGFLAKTLY